MLPFDSRAVFVSSALQVVHADGAIGTPRSLPSLLAFGVLMCNPRAPHPHPTSPQVFIVVRCQNTVGLWVTGWQEGGIRRDDDPPRMQGTVFDWYEGQDAPDYQFTKHKTQAGAQWYGWTFTYAPLGGLHYAVTTQDFDIDSQPNDVVWLNYTKVDIAVDGSEYFRDRGNQVTPHVVTLAQPSPSTRPLPHTQSLPLTQPPPASLTQGFA